MRDEVANLIVGLQFQDRMSQMLSQVVADMSKLHGQAAAANGDFDADPAAWLAELQATYAMQEQRRNHGECAESDDAGGITFF